MYTAGDLMLLKLRIGDKIWVSFAIQFRLQSSMSTKQLIFFSSCGVKLLALPRLKQLYSLWLHLVKLKMSLLTLMDFVVKAVYFD